MQFQNAQFKILNEATMIIVKDRERVRSERDVERSEREVERPESEKEREVERSI